MFLAEPAFPDVFAVVVVDTILAVAGDLGVVCLFAVVSGPIVAD